MHSRTSVSERRASRKRRARRTEHECSMLTLLPSGASSGLGYLTVFWLSWASKMAWKPPAIGSSLLLLMSNFDLAGVVSFFSGLLLPKMDFFTDEKKLPLSFSFSAGFSTYLLSLAFSPSFLYPKSSLICLFSRKLGRIFSLFIYEINFA